MATHSDEHLEYFGNLFVAANLHSESGMTFDEFMQNPQAILSDIVVTNCLSGLQEVLDILNSNEYLGLLPPQRAVQQRLDYEAQQQALEQPHKGRVLELHGDRLLTPMYHRDRSKSWKTRRVQA